MPNDVKAIVSILTLVVAVCFAFWERTSGQPHLFGFVIGLAIFAVAAMWVFPEAGVKKGDLPPRNAKE
jgi:hypothetical protein